MYTRFIDIICSIRVQLYNHLVCRYIGVAGSSTDRITACNSSDAMYGYASFLGSDDTVQLTNCPSSFYFTSGYTCPSAASVSVSCAGGNTNGVITDTPVDFNSMSNMPEYTVITYGPFAGQVCFPHLQSVLCDAFRPQYRTSHTP